MPTPEYTIHFRTPQARVILRANPPRKELTGLTPDQRTQRYAEHRHAWLQARTEGIGASDIPAILGIDPHGSLTDLYAQKTAHLTRPETSYTRIGHELEPVALTRFREATGLKTRRTGLLVNIDQPWMRCTPDSLANGGAPVQIKTTTKRDHGNEWSHEPDDRAAAQVMWEMAVTGATHGWVGVLFRDTGEFTYYRVERDDELIEIMVERASAFWHGNVLQSCAPPLDGSEATLEAVRALNPRHRPDKVVDGGEKAAQVRRRLGRIQAEKKRLEREENEAKAELAAMGGDADVLTANGAKVATLRQNGTFRAKDYRRDHPDRAKKYEVPTTKLDTRAALAGHPDARDYLSRPVRLAGEGWDFPWDFTGAGLFGQR